jgi:hypothetical protein
VKLPPYRWSLPIGHVAIDAAILTLLTGPAASALIDAGNLPAAVLAHSLPMHEAAAVAIWFLMGLGIDTGRFRLHTEMILFLAGRLLLVMWTRAALSVWRPAVSLQLLFWLALAIWAAGWCILRFIRPRHSSERQPEA